MSWRVLVPIGGPAVTALAPGVIGQILSFPAAQGPATGELCVDVEVFTGAGQAPPFFNDVYPSIEITNSLTLDVLASKGWPDTVTDQFSSRTFTFAAADITEPDPWVPLAIRVWAEPGAGTLTSWGAYPYPC